MKILLSRDVIAARVRALGAELSRVYRGRRPVCVALMNGALPFAADLIRAMDIPLELDTLSVSSYAGQHSTGEIKFRSSLKLPVAGRDVLLIDDILDSGVTLRRLSDYLLREANAAQVRTCVLLDKKIPRKPEALAHADYTGFEIEDLFVVGYGLDNDEQFRNLPDISVCD